MGSLGSICIIRRIAGSISHYCFLWRCDITGNTTLRWNENLSTTSATPSLCNAIKGHTLICSTTYIWKKERERKKNKINLWRKESCLSTTAIEIIVKMILEWRTTKRINMYVNIKQQLSSFSVNYERLKGWPDDILRSLTRISDSVCQGWEFTFLTGSQVMLMLLAWGPHFENHWEILVV